MLDIDTFVYTKACHDSAWLYVSLVVTHPHLCGCISLAQ